MNLRFRASGPMLVSGMALGVVALVVLTSLPALLSAFLTPDTDSVDPSTVVAQLLDRHDEDFDQYRKRFLGRSAFYPPPSKPAYRPPPPPPPPREDEDDTPPPPPPPPKAPANYQGPSISYVVGSTVYFKPLRPDEGLLDVPVGHEREGVSVIAINAPWSVKVGYKGGEYEVAIFEDKTDGLLSAPKPASEEIPGLIKIDPEPESTEPLASAGSLDGGDRSDSGGSPPSRESDEK